MFAPPSVTKRVWLTINQEFLASGVYLDGQLGQPPKRLFMADGTEYDAIQLGYASAIFYTITIGNIRYTIPKEYATAVPMHFNEDGEQLPSPGNATGQAMYSASKFFGNPITWIIGIVGFWALGKFVFKWKWI